jgi:glycosyl transferase, family 25
MQQFDALCDCFVVSLNRTPERLKTFLEQNAKCDINFQHFEAVDGTLMDDATIARFSAPGAVYKRSQFGCAMSHLALWQKCAEQTKNFVLFEDDAVVRHDIKTRLPSLLAKAEDWHIILMGGNTDVPLELKITPSVIYGGGFSARHPTPEQLAEFATSNYPVSLHHLNFGMGSCGYVVSPAGAKVLMQKCFPLDNRIVYYASLNYKFRAYSIDAMMTTIYSQISAYACLAPLVMTANDQATSLTTNEA